MKYGWTYILACTTLVGAQSIDDLPICSLSCFAKAVAETNCAQTDYKCQCTPTNNAAIKSFVTPCLAQSICTIAELSKVQQFGATFCPSVLAETSPKSAPSSAPITSSTSPSISQHTSSTLPPSSITSNTQRAAPIVSPTVSTAGSQPTGANNLGLGIDGTRWKSVHNTSNTNRGPAIEAVCITLWVVAASVVAFRIYARLRTRQLRQNAQGLGWDEFFACVALLLVGGIVASIIAGVRYGMGKHQDHQTPSQAVKIIQVVYAFTLIIVLCFWSLKMSILCLYLRMTPEKTHRRAVYGIMIFVCLYATATLFANMFECTPISDFWNIEDISNNKWGCINIIVMDVFTNSWSAFEDLVIWALPIPILWNLKVPSAKKFGLYTLIAISFISVICAAIRVAAFVIWINSSDISWNFPIYPLLCTIESCVALITSSLYAIYPLFRKPAPEHRRSVFPAAPSESEKQWDSQGSTLGAAQAGDRRSRWSFLSWRPPGKKGLDEGGMVKSVPEEEAEESKEGCPPTQHTMTAYVNSADEARSVGEKSMRVSSHRRKFSSEEESLCYIGKGSDGVSAMSDDEKVR